MKSFMGNMVGVWDKDNIKDILDVEDHSSTPYVKITSLEDGNVIKLERVYRRREAILYADFQYSMDGVTWSPYQVWFKSDSSGEKQDGDEITINRGQSVYFRNTRGSAIACVHTWSWSNDAPSIVSYHHFITTGKFNVSGNLMAMINYQNLGGVLPTYGACYLFAGCDKLIDASNLQLPKYIGVESLVHLFAGCSSMTRAPILRFTLIQGEFALYEMFASDENLLYIVWDSSLVFQRSTITSYYSDMLFGVVFYTKSDFDVEASREIVPHNFHSRWSLVKHSSDPIQDMKAVELVQNYKFVENEFNRPDWMEVTI